MVIKIWHSKPTDWDDPLMLTEQHLIPDDWYGKRAKNVELTEGWAMTAMAPRPDGTSPLTPPRDGYTPSISWIAVLAVLTWIGVVAGLYYGVTRW